VGVVTTALRSQRRPRCCPGWSEVEALPCPASLSEARDARCEAPTDAVLGEATTAQNGRYDLGLVEFPSAGTYDLCILVWAGPVAGFGADTVRLDALTFADHPQQPVAVDFQLTAR